MLKQLLLFVLVGIMISSCITDPTTDEILNIENEFKISLSQNLTKEGSQLSLITQTLVGQDCSDNEIESYLALNNDQTLVYNIEEIQKGSNCENGPYFVNTQNNIAVDNQDYHISIYLKNALESSGTLIINDEAYELQMTSLTGISIGKTYVKKIPSDILWGSIKIENTLATPYFVYEQFDENIQSALSMEHGLTSGDYDYFEINTDSSNTIKIPSLFDKNSTSTQFVFKIIGDLDQLKTDLTQFKIDNPELTLNIMDWTGDVY